MDSRLIEQIRELAEQTTRPFYIYERERIVEHCRAFTSIPYANKAIHFASMANATREFLELVRDHGLKIFVNSPGHLTLAQELGFRGHDIVYTASAMDAEQLGEVHAAGALLNLDSPGQLALHRELYPGEPMGIRCNIGDLVDPRYTRAGYFLGSQSRLGLTVEEIEAETGAKDISGLHLYIGTDLLELDYFEACYTELARLTRLFPELWFVDLGGGFGLPKEQGGEFPFEQYASFVSALMERLTADLGRSIRLILEPGRIIGGEAGHFVCRVTDVKQRNGSQLVGVNGSSTQFPRPLFYPDDAHHPLTVLPSHRNGNGNGSPKLHSMVFGCSTYSRDYLSRDVELPEVQIGDLMIFAQAGSYCASAYTHFLGFPQPEEFFV